MTSDRFNPIVQPATLSNVGRHSHANESWLGFLGWRSAMVVAWLAASVGCGQRHTYSTARIAGMVRVDGKAVESGTISFLPRTKGGGKAVTAEIQDGRYAATVPKGTLQVLPFATVESGNTIMELGQPIPERVNLIPESYRDGWTIEVQGENNAQDFDLHSR